MSSGQEGGERTVPLGEMKATEEHSVGWPHGVGRRQWAQQGHTEVWVRVKHGDVQESAWVGSFEERMHLRPAGCRHLATPQTKPWVPLGSLHSQGHRQLSNNHVDRGQRPLRRIFRQRLSGGGGEEGGPGTADAVGGGRVPHSRAAPREPEREQAREEGALETVWPAYLLFVSPKT